MNFLRKVNITAVHERVVIARCSGVTVKWCPRCAEGGLMVTATVAASLTRQSIRKICRLVDAEQIHYQDEPDGLLICLSSLAVQ